MSGLTAIVTWLIWAIFIFVIGVKLFPDKQTKVSFKKVLTAVGFAHAPGLLRFFAAFVMSRMSALPISNIS